MSKPLALTGSAAAAVAGLVLALLVLAPSASAWDWHALPAGYAITSSYTTVCHVATDPCVDGEGSTCTHLGISAAGAGSFNETDCVNPTFQADLDAFVDSTICTVNPAAGGAACQPASTSAPPETATQPATTTEPTPPATTEPGTTTVETAPPTTTTLATTIVDPAIAALNDRVAALEQALSALTSRVARLELAVDASQAAFEQQLAQGADVATAAAVARATYLNAVYGLGEFAP